MSTKQEFDDLQKKSVDIGEFFKTIGLTIIVVSIVVIVMSFIIGQGTTAWIGSALLAIFLLFFGILTSDHRPKIKDDEENIAPSVYIYTLKDSGRTFYVGQTIDPAKRLRQHIRSAKAAGTKNERYIYEIKQRGQRPQMQIIAHVPKQDANDFEEKYIKRLGKTNTMHR